MQTQGQESPPKQENAGDGTGGCPEAAEGRKELGHWEIDSAAGEKSDKAAVPALIERTARNQIAIKLGWRGSEAVDAVAGEAAGSFGEAADKVFTSTAGDNGREFAGREGTPEAYRHP
ncbi:MAG: hypothetical protein LBU32_16055 [Clostridiales bacterium]|jgi:IS30 family transposase|nr:hypothetical protein [Clostridiales bacterium]